MLSDDDRDDIRLIVREELRARMRTLYVNVAFAIIAGLWRLGPSLAGHQRPRLSDYDAFCAA